MCVTAQTDFQIYNSIFSDYLPDSFLSLVSVHPLSITTWMINTFLFKLVTFSTLEFMSLFQFLASKDNLLLFASVPLTLPAFMPYPNMPCIVQWN